MISNFPAVEYGPLYHHKLEKDKTMALSKAKGNFEASMILSDEAKVELNWWLNNIKSSFKNIQPTPIDIDLYSDASKTVGVQSSGTNLVVATGANRRHLPT